MRLEAETIKRSSHLVILVAACMILTHSTNKVEDRYEGANSIVITAQCHVRKANIVICRHMTGSHSSEKCLGEFRG